eukprot:gb/GECG01005094.1/.p1 GENE.gb/GECG01005094.1/~~gb/GECG01005094.1/.p1  ORF type:complete len:190 (+),score=18.19 gb/GECG01005094.1/:1-570(+)
MFDFHTWLNLPPWKPAFKPPDTICPHCDLGGTLDSTCCKECKTEPTLTQKPDTHQGGRRLSYAESLHKSASEYSSARRRSRTRTAKRCHRKSVSPGTQNRLNIAQRFGKDELQRRSQLERAANSARWDEEKFEQIFTPKGASDTRDRGFSKSPYDGKQQRTHSFRIKYGGMFDIYPDFTGPKGDEAGIE